MDPLQDLEHQQVHPEGRDDSEIPEDAAASIREGRTSDRRLTLRQRPPKILIPPPAGPPADRSIAPADPSASAASPLDLPSNGAAVGLGITLQDFSPNVIISPPVDHFQGASPEDVSGATLTVGSARRESSLSPTFSDLVDRRQLPDNELDDGPTSPYPMIGLPTPDIARNSVVGGDFDNSWGSFSFVGRGRPSPAMDTRSEPGPVPSSRTSSSSSEESSRSHPINGAVSTKKQRLKAKIDSLSIQVLQLRQKNVEQGQESARLQSESSAKYDFQAYRLKTQFRSTLQAFKIIRPDNVHPIWKQDTDGTRLGPLYEDVPSIYRESAVEVLLARVRLQRMLEDYDAMVTIALRALITAKSLKFAPLTARCHFVHGIALFHTHHFNDALQEFLLSYGCADEYGIADDFVDEWRERCVDAMESTWSVPEETPTEAFPRIDSGPTHSGISATARKSWGLPADYKSNVKNDQADVRRRRRASTFLQPQSLSGILDGDDDHDYDENDDDDTATGSPTTAGNDYEPRYHLDNSIGTPNESISRDVSSTDGSDSIVAPSYDQEVSGSRPRTSTTVLFRNSFQFEPKKMLDTPVQEEEETANDVDPTLTENHAKTSTQIQSQDYFSPRTAGDTSLSADMTDSPPNPETAIERPRADTALRDPGGYFVEANNSSRAINTESRPRANSVFTGFPGFGRSLSGSTYSPTKPKHFRSRSLFAGSGGSENTISEFLASIAYSGRPIAHDSAHGSTKPKHFRSKSLFSGSGGNENTLSDFQKSIDPSARPTAQNPTRRSTGDPPVARRRSSTLLDWKGITLRSKDAGSNLEQTEALGRASEYAMKAGGE